MNTRISLLLGMILMALPAIAQESGWIGISIEDQKDPGAMIRNVEPNSPAAKAGLKEGDVILQFNKQDVAGVLQLMRLVRETPAGRSVELKVRRDNRDQTFSVTTEKPPNEFARLGIQWPDTRGIIRQIPQIQVTTAYTQSGIRVEQMTDQLRDFFGVFSNLGVLVASVEKGSDAEKAGLKAGDVIVSIDGKNVRTPADFNREMRAPGSKPALKIFREKQEREIKIE